MEDVVREGAAAFGGVFAGCRVLVTGHTGFTGAWACLWLSRLGARVRGLSLDPPSDPHLHALARLGEVAPGDRADVRDAAAVAAAVAGARPELVVHLAAQPLVLAGYADPVGTFATNVMGTVNVLEAVRRTPSVRAAVVVTSDKVYAPADRPHTEASPLGGRDPYSASKSACEHVVTSWRASFLGPAGVGVASVRAGNVIGGGDFGAHRVVPDWARALRAGDPLRLRHPGAVRPWQHVLDAVAGYLAVAAALLDGDAAAADAWNVGPDGGASVGELVALLDGGVSETTAPAPPAAVDAAGAPLPGDPAAPPETGYLGLDASRLRAALGWRPSLDLPGAAALTRDWYLGWARDPRFDARAACAAQLEEFAAAAAEAALPGAGLRQAGGRAVA